MAGGTIGSVQCRSVSIPLMRAERAPSAVPHCTPPPLPSPPLPSLPLSSPCHTHAHRAHDYRCTYNVHAPHNAHSLSPTRPPSLPPPSQRLAHSEYAHAHRRPGRGSCCPLPGCPHSHRSLSVSVAALATPPCSQALATRPAGRPTPANTGQSGWAAQPLAIGQPMRLKRRLHAVSLSLIDPAGPTSASAAGAQPNGGSAPEVAAAGGGRDSALAAPPPAKVARSGGRGGRGAGRGRGGGGLAGSGAAAAAVDTMDFDLLLMPVATSGQGGMLVAGGAQPHGRAAPNQCGPGGGAQPPLAPATARMPAAGMYGPVA